MVVLVVLVFEPRFPVTSRNASKIAHLSRHTSFSDFHLTLSLTKPTCIVPLLTALILQGSHPLATISSTAVAKNFRCVHFAIEGITLFMLHRKKCSLHATLPSSEIDCHSIRSFHYVVLYVVSTFGEWHCYFIRSRNVYLTSICLFTVHQKL